MITENVERQFERHETEAKSFKRGGKKSEIDTQDLKREKTIKENFKREATKAKELQKSCFLSSFKMDYNSLKYLS